MKKLLLLLLAFITILVCNGQVQVVTLNGSGSSDADGTIVGWNWSALSTNPGPTVIANPNVSITTVVPANGQQWKVGTYKFVLTVIDNLGDNDRDTMQVTIIPNPDKPPVVSVGPDLTVILPGNTVTLRATASDPDGTVVHYQWNMVTGPNQAVFNRQDSSVVIASGLIAGTYAFRCKVTDNLGASSADTLLVTVRANTLPASKAGPDQTITLPLTTVALGGNDSPEDARIDWAKLYGGRAVIADPHASFTNVDQLQPGFYIFQKKVTNTAGQYAVDYVYVVVKGPTRKAF